MSNEIVDLLAKLRTPKAGEPAVDPIVREALVSVVVQFIRATEDPDQPHIAALADRLLERARRIVRAR